LDAESNLPAVVPLWSKTEFLEHTRRLSKYVLIAPGLILFQSLGREVLLEIHSELCSQILWSRERGNCVPVQLEMEKAFCR